MYEFAYNNCLTQYENCVVNAKFEPIRFQYSRGYFTVYELEIAQHLTISEENYDPAVQI